MTDEMPREIWAVMLDGQPKPVDTPANATRYVRADTIERPVVDEIINALSEAGKRCQSFLDTFEDIGDCVTQADIDDWFLVEKRLRDMRGPFWTREAYDQMMADGAALTESLKDAAQSTESETK